MKASRAKALLTEFSGLIESGVSPSVLHGFILSAIAVSSITDKAAKEKMEELAVAGFLLEIEGELENNG